MSVTPIKCHRHVRIIYVTWNGLGLLFSSFYHYCAYVRWKQHIKRFCFHLSWYFFFISLFTRTAQINSIIHYHTWKLVKANGVFSLFACENFCLLFLSFELVIFTIFSLIWIAHPTHHSNYRRLLIYFRGTWQHFNWLYYQLVS